ncbi:MAG: rod shape-determining protein MreC [Thermoactinospora sp.]|nr:rod shape-determining protein MreC [Thermoactinospora sp.]
MRRPVVLVAGLVLAAGAVAVLDRVTPLREAVSAVYGTAESLVRVPGDLRPVEEENARLRAEVLALRQAVPGNGSGKAARAGVAAHVVGFGDDGRTVTIDAGGLPTDVTVVDRHGLFGRVTWSGPVTSTVTLLTDDATSFGVRMTGSREIGVVSGVVSGVPGRRLLRMRLLNAGAPLRAGDLVETLGSAGRRPWEPGVPVGRVLSVEETPGAPTRTALVEPLAGLTAPGLVTVITPAGGRP